MLLTELFNTIAKTAIRDEKVELLKAHADWFLKFLLKEAYSGKPKVKVPPELIGTGDYFLEDANQSFVGAYSILNKENNKKIISNQLKRLFKVLEPASASLVKKVLARDLECGLTVNIINKAFPGLIERFDFPRHKAATVNRIPIYASEKSVFVYNKINSYDCVCYKGHKGWNYVLRSGRELKSLTYINGSLNKLAQSLDIPISRGLCFVGKLCSKGKLIDKFIKTDSVCTDILFVPILVGRIGAFVAQDGEKFKPITSLWEPIKFLHRLPIYEVDVKLIPLVIEKYYALQVPSVELRHSTDLLGFDTAIVDMDTSVRPDFNLQLITPCLVIDVKTKQCKYPIDGRLSDHIVVEYITVRQENGVDCIVINGLSKELRQKYIDNTATDIIGKAVEIRCHGYDTNWRMQSPTFIKLIEGMDWESIEFLLEDNRVM